MIALLIPLATLLGIEVDQLVERFRRNAIAWSALAFFVLIGIFFLFAALNAWLTEAWGPVLAPFAIAVGSLLVALAIYLSVTSMASAARRRELERQRSTDKTALVTTAAVTALPLILQSGLMRKVGIPVGAALAAAFLMSRKAADRKAADND